MREGNAAPHSLMTDVDFTALVGNFGIASPTPYGPNINAPWDRDPWLAVYDDGPKQSIYKAKVTCNFAGTTVSKIQTSNQLTCSLSSTNFVFSPNREDWAYQAYATVLNSGTVKVGAEVWRSCTYYAGWDDPDNPPNCNGWGAGKVQVQYVRTYVIYPSSMSDGITLYMQWSPDGTKVKWYYKLASSVYTIPFASHTKMDHQHSWFNTGKFYPIIPNPHWIYLLQAGINSEYPIAQSGFSVKIKNPAYATVQGGSYNTYFATGKSIQGDAAWFNGGYYWGGSKYTDSQATNYECVGDVRGQVRFSYKFLSTPASGVQYWPC